MARVNVDSKLRHDPRLFLLARLAGCTVREALGGLLCVWFACYDRASTELPEDEAEVAAEGPAFLAAMVGARLAAPTGRGTIRFAGVEERIGYLMAAAEAGRVGGQARALKAGQKLRGSPDQLPLAGTQGPLHQASEPLSEAAPIVRESTAVQRTLKLPPDQLTRVDLQTSGTEACGAPARGADAGHPDPVPEAVVATGPATTPGVLGGPLAASESGSPIGAGIPAERPATGRTRGKRARGEGAPGYQAVVDGFDRMFRDRMGGSPGWGGTEGRLVKGLLTKAGDGGAEEVLRRAAVMLDMRGRWPAEHPDLGTLSAHWAKFVGGAAAKPRGLTAAELDDIAHGRRR